MPVMDERKVEEMVASEGICACTGHHVLQRVEELPSGDWILHLRGVLGPIMVPSTFAGVQTQITDEISYRLVSKMSFPEHVMCTTRATR